ncbi:MAG TPA: hypothetical protein VGG74_03110 [Kofleriaceae bacterium]|jgi:hypothetical protein
MQRLVWVVMLGACATPSNVQMARDSFASAYQCKSGDVEARTDVAADAYEVLGCGKDVIYECDQTLTNSDDNVFTSPSCTLTDWCTQPGCMSDDPKAASAQFSTDASCPLPRVTAQRIPDPVRPSPDIAGDPSRLALWQQQEFARTRHLHYLAVQGCNVSAQYECRNRKPNLPACSRVIAGTADVGSGAPVGSAASAGSVAGSAGSDMLQ